MSTPELMELRARLLAAAGQDLDRQQMRRRRVVATTAVVATLGATSTAAFGGVAAAAGAATDLAGEVMHVFGRAPRSEAETTPPHQFAEDNLASGAMTPGIEQPGAPTSPNAGRLLLEHSDPGVIARIWAIPTKDGQTCFIAKIARSQASDEGDPGGGGCVKSLPDSWPISVLSGGVRPNSRTAIYGVVADSVKSVRVRADGGWTEAIMGENAVLWFAASATAIPDQIEVTRNDGSTMRHPFHLVRPDWLNASAA